MTLRTATYGSIAMAILLSLVSSPATGQNTAPRQRMAPPPAAPSTVPGGAPGAAAPRAPQPGNAPPAYQAAQQYDAPPRDRVAQAGRQGPAPGQPAPAPGPSGLPQLSPLQQAELDHILAAWEAASDKVNTLTTTFYLWEYNKAFATNDKPEAVIGELHFAAPDKGYYKVTRGEPQHWVCDGKSMYEFDFKQKRLKEYPLPPELQGKAITNGPLPFVFGAKAGALKNRYWMQVITPPEAKNEIWIRALPLWQQDAANFNEVHVILDTTTMLPKAIQMFDPNPQIYKVYAFEKTKVNGTFDSIKDFFRRPTTPFGWKYEEVEPPAAALPQAQPQPPAAADARGLPAPARPPQR